MKNTPDGDIKSVKFFNHGPLVQNKLREERELLYWDLRHHVYPQFNVEVVQIALGFEEPREGWFQLVHLSLGDVFLADLVELQVDLLHLPVA